jgi:hypothetical protein
VDEPKQTIKAGVRNNLIVLELSAPAARIGLTPEGWEALRHDVDGLVEALKVREEQSRREGEGE